MLNHHIAMIFPDYLTSRSFAFPNELKELNACRLSCHCVFRSKVEWQMTQVFFGSLLYTCVIWQYHLPNNITYHFLFIYLSSYHWCDYIINVIISLMWSYHWRDHIISLYICQQCQLSLSHGLAISRISVTSLKDNSQMTGFHF